MSMNLRTGIMALALAAAVVLGGAAQQPAHQGHETQPRPNTSSVQSMKMTMPATTDAEFIEMMRKHHQEGIELSKIEDDQAF